MPFNPPSPTKPRFGEGDPLDPIGEQEARRTSEAIAAADEDEGTRRGIAHV